MRLVKRVDLGGKDKSHSRRHRGAFPGPFIKPKKNDGQSALDGD